MSADEARERLRYVRAAVIAWWATRRDFHREGPAYWITAAARQHLQTARRRTP